MSLFITSDTHFGHAKILSFIDQAGEPLRPGFASLDHMHDELVRRWNSVVHNTDTVYHLGDVAISRSGLKVLERLNGRKILIRGNHDIFKMCDYAQYFDDIRGCHHRDGLMFSHVPLHRDSFTSERYKGNVHGHLHKYVVEYKGNPDPLYFNACVERNDFTPVPWEKVRAYFGL